MGGLGNARRGGRSPPLLIGALIACVLVLGFNYWVSSSRNLELQTRLVEIEGGVRRAVAERDAVEQKKKEFEEELRIQSDQITRMEGRYKVQLENVLSNFKQEKATLMLNISSSTRTIQTLKAQLTSLDKIPKELQDCQTNEMTLSTALTDCKAQMADLLKECTSKLPQQEKSPPVSPPSQEKSGGGAGQSEKLGPDDTKKPYSPALKSNLTDTHPDAHKYQLPGLETNEIPKAGDDEVSLTGRDLSKPVLPVATRKSDAPRPVSMAKQGKELEVMESRTGKLQTAGNVVRVERGGKPEDKPGDQPGDKPGDQRNTVDVEALKQAQLKGKDQGIGRAPLDLKNNIADYNGDDENEGEFEADKQAELAKI